MIRFIKLHRCEKNRLRVFVDPVTTPTMAKAEHDRWSGHRKARPKVQVDETHAAG